jgi:hypothetical protein
MKHKYEPNIAKGRETWETACEEETETPNYATYADCNFLCSFGPSNTIIGELSERLHLLLETIHADRDYLNVRKRLHHRCQTPC